MKLVFAGCSFTAGHGWDESDTRNDCPESPYLWTNLCHTKIPSLAALTQVNIGISGGSNTEIFESVVNCVATNQIDTLFCQWTAMPRYTLKVGFELWPTDEPLQKSRSTYTHDIGLNNGTTYSRIYINDLLDRVRALHHLHWEIVKVVKYSNIISNLAKLLGIKNVFFINGLCPWDDQYFTELHDVFPEDYTNFTKREILNIKTRTDEDILKLYQIAHGHYAEAGGVDESKWINLYDPFGNHRIDFNFDGKHPGAQSNNLYFDTISNKLNKLI